MTACPPIDRLKQLLSRDDTLAEDGEVVAHLDTCVSCQVRLEELGGADRLLLTAVDSLQTNTFIGELPLRRVLNELRGDDATIVSKPLDRTSWVKKLLRPVESLDGLGEIGGYEVTEILGQGSMGLVLKARDVALKRWVALKLLTPDLAGDAVSRQRFAREAQAAAAIHHESVTTIHRVSEDNGLPYIVMEYVEGGSLQDYLDRQGRSDWRTVAELGAEVAEGLTAAHAQGLVHRDIKPSNILLTPGPSPLTPRVKLCDFGLARVADDVRLTQTGIVAGTPMYMSPEQAEGKPLDARADLFSLGSVLYTLATGTEPFRAPSPLAVLKQVCEGKPAPIRKLNPDIPDWLAGCIERLHAKAPEDRFQSAAELAEFLRYNLEHPEAPRHVPPPRPKRRRPPRPVRVALLTVGVLVILLLGGWAFRSWQRARSNNELTNPLPVVGVLDGHEGPVTSLAFSPNGETLASGGDDRTLRLWDPATGKEKHQLPKHSSRVSSIVFAHSGKFLLTPDGDGSVRLWDFSTNKEEQLLHGRNGTIQRLALSPDDRLLAVVPSTPQVVEIWDMTSHSLHQTISGAQSTIFAIAFSPDGRTLATGTDSGRIQLWDPGTGEQIRESTPGSPVRALAFTPDGESIAALTRGDKEISLCSLENFERLRTFESTSELLSMAISRDGEFLAAGSPDGTARIWRLADAELLVTLHAHQGRALVAFSPDGHTLATAGEDHLVKLWDLTSMGH